MLLELPASLHYPITIIELLKQPNDDVAKREELFKYSFKTKVLEGDSFGEEKEVEKTFYAKFPSSAEGTLTKWKIREGAVISSNRTIIAEIVEVCPHDVQFGGMCVNCGKDMTEVSYNTDRPDNSRAQINMIHDNNSLRISQDEATRVEEEAKRRLLKSKKLSLVVDLDQTIIHATVDPTVAEWQQDPENPNYESVKDVRKFQLIDDGPGGRGCWYYIKLRPGLKSFLENISKLYELHIYTMGTRAYAQHISKIVDPERKIFGDRILSRDESGSLTAKNLQRLFPVDTKMVVIIDDRGDVWKWSDNLIKVTPYDFFVGIGDINSSFLPKKPDMAAPDVKPEIEVVTEVANGDSAEAVKVETSDSPKSEDSADFTSQSSVKSSETADTDQSALEVLVSMGGGDDPTVLDQQSSKQEETIAAQQQERPLAQMQKQKDAEADAAEAAEAAEADGDVAVNGTPDSGALTKTESNEHSKQRHQLLIDNDNELYYLERSLTKVHSNFFDDYERKLSKAQGGRIAALRGSKGVNKVSLRDGADLEMVPDIKTIMPQMKLRVLEGVTLVMTGVLPTNPFFAETSDIWKLAQSFGARVEKEIRKHTTHVIAGRPRTNKVRQAARRPHIKIVTRAWLDTSIMQWQRVEEEPYLIPIHPDDRNPAPGDDDDVATVTSNEEMHGTLSEDGEIYEDTDDELKAFMPDPLELDEGGVSPVETLVNVDWGDVDAELAEFMDGEPADSDNESVNSMGSESLNSRASESGGELTSPRKRKYNRSGTSTPTEEGNENVEGSGSSLSKRVKIARARSTNLNLVERASTPSVGGTEGSAEVNGEGDEELLGDDDDDDFDFDKELEAEMEKEEQRQRENSRDSSNSGLL